MLIDSTTLMYEACQSCRHMYGDAGVMAALLGKTIQLVRQEGTFRVAIPDEWTIPLGEYARHAISVLPDTTQEIGDELSVENEPFLSLLEIGARELQQLLAIEAIRAVRSLGYAFHNIPGLLRTPEQFDPKQYRFCFRIVSAHWDKLSIEMRLAFCKIMGLEPDKAEMMIKIPGFPINMWRSVEEQ